MSPTTTNPIAARPNCDDHRLTRAVAPALETIAANATKAEADRQVPLENVELLRDAGFLRAFQPARFGGDQIGPEVYAAAVVDVAGACASTAWAMGLLAQHSHMLGLMSEELQHEVWDDDPHALASSSVAPLGKAEPARGGIHLSGTFGWSSGCDHASWAILGFRWPDALADGEPRTHFAVVPRTDYEILDDWHVAGLRGTGSKTLVLDDVFVPQHRIESGFALSTGRSQGYGSNDGFIFNAAFAHYFAIGFSAVSIGIGKRFLELYAAKTKTRVRAYTGTGVGQTVPAYTRLAESHHQLNAAEASLRADWRAMSARSAAGELPTRDEDVGWRTNQAYVTNQAIAAVDRLYTASGGSAWFDDNEMQRLWRDSKMTGAHTYSDYDIASQRQGRHLLGLEPDSANF